MNEHEHHAHEHCEHNHHEHDHCDCCHDAHCHDDGCGCGHDHEHSHDMENKGEFLFKVITGAVLLGAGYIISEFTSLPDFVSLLCFGISYLLVGFSILKEAVEGIIHGNIFNECFLMAVASIGAFAIGEYTEGCAVVLLYTVGEFLQGMALGKSRKSIKDMLEMKPAAVKIMRDGQLIEIKPEEVKVGDEFIVNAGERIDIDGVIVNGSAEVDMSALTGESIPVSMAKGSEVLSGAVCLDGTLTIRAENQVSRPVHYRRCQARRHRQHLRPLCPHVLRNLRFRCRHSRTLHGRGQRQTLPGI